MNIKSKKLNKAVDDFVVQMKNRLAKKEREGYTGWNKSRPTNYELYMQIKNNIFLFDTTDNENLKKKYLIDIANRAMMLYNRVKE